MSIAFYLDGNYIGNATVVFGDLGKPPTTNVTFNVCQQVTTTQGSCVSYNITGSVADCDQPTWHLPIAGATVYVLSHPEIPAKTTDASGCFDLGAVPAGTYTVMAVKGAQSGFADITLPDVIPPCGDCNQIFICASSNGPCPNAATANMCCDWLATHNTTLYQQYCAPTTTTTRTTPTGTTTTGTTETGTTGETTTGTTETLTTTVTTTRPTCVYDPAWLAGCPNTMVWVVGPGGAVQVPASDIQAYVPPSPLLPLLVLVAAIILAAIAYLLGGRGGGGKAGAKR